MMKYHSRLSKFLFSDFMITKQPLVINLASQVLGYRKECTGFGTWKFQSLEMVICSNTNWHSNVRILTYTSFSSSNCLPEVCTYISESIHLIFLGRKYKEDTLFPLTTITIIFSFSFPVLILSLKRNMKKK